MTETELSRLHAIVKGSVQGVGFRNFVQLTASSLHLTGWVRNRYDGSVEVVAEGERGSLSTLLLALYQGPRSAEVDEVENKWLLPTGEFPRFQIRF